MLKWKKNRIKIFQSHVHIVYICFSFITRNKDVVIIRGEPPVSHLNECSVLLKPAQTVQCSCWVKVMGKKKRLMVHSGKSSTKSVKESTTAHRTGWKRMGRNWLHQEEEMMRSRETNVGNHGQYIDNLKVYLFGFFIIQAYKRPFDEVLNYLR